MRATRHRQSVKARHLPGFFDFAFDTEFGSIAKAVDALYRCSAC